MANPKSLLKEIDGLKKSIYLDLKEEKLGRDLHRIYEYLGPIIEER